LFCNETQVQYPIIQMTATAATQQFYVPSSVPSTCITGILKIRTDSAPFVYGYSQPFSLIQTVIPVDTLPTPFVADPVFQQVFPPLTSVAPDVPIVPVVPVVPPISPPSYPFTGTYPVNVSITAGQIINLTWDTTYPATNTVTIILYAGNITSNTAVTTYTTAAPNSGSYSLSLNSSLTPGPYFFMLRTVYNDSKVITYLQFTVI